MAKETPPTYTWIEMYKMRKAAQKPTPGRPAFPYPRTRAQVLFTAKEKSLLVEWQNKLTPIMGRKPGLGEIAGLLAHMINEITAMNGVDLDDFDSLEDLVFSITQKPGQDH